MQRIMFTLVIFISSSLALFAETAGSDIIKNQIENQDKAEFSDAIFGVGMWPIWLCSFVLIALIFERIKGLKREKVIDRTMIDSFTQHISKHDIDSALSVAQKSDTVVGRAWSQAIEEFKLGGVSIQDALTNKSLLAFKPLKRNLQAIATLGVISPLFGLLGTVSGMILTFQQISATGGADKSALAMGIGLALFTTAGGLIVAIPAIVSGRFFNSRLISYAEEIEDDIHRVNYRYNSHNVSNTEKAESSDNTKKTKTEEDGTSAVKK